MDSFSDVLVVGAGPVGLMAAAELHRHGVPCRLIERLAAPSLFCKALGVTPRTMEMWDDLGIAHQALSAGMTLRGLVTLVNGQPTGEPAGALPEGGYGFLTLAQYDAERILTEHLAAVGGRIERGVELTELKQSDDGVQAQLRHADGKTEVAGCRYLLGCDGGRSLVRSALGLDFVGEHYEQVFMLADVELDWNPERGFAYKLARWEEGEMRGGGACIPVPGNPRRYRVSTGAPPEMIPHNLSTTGTAARWASDVGPTLEQVQEMIDYLYPPGAKASNLRWSSFYRISHRIVAQYRQGQAFLAGDAAHLHPPIGGQGMNAGLQDAYNLAWKLALVIRGQAPPTLLDSYDAERRAVGEQIVQRTTGRMDRMLAGQIDAQEPMREDSQLYLNYRDSAWVANELADSPGSTYGPLAGDRAPDVSGLRRPSVRHAPRLFDLLRGTHHTLLFYTNVSPADEDCAQAAAIVAYWRERYAAPLAAYMLLHEECGAVAREDLPTVYDTANEFARTYGAGRGSLFLIRPDGYVAYRSHRFEREPWEMFLNHVLAQRSPRKEFNDS